MAYGTAVDCHIEDNRATTGGGLYNGTAIDCTITNNYASHRGGGMYGGAAIGCTIEGNTADYGGGMSGDGAATNCVIAGNTGWADGGGLHEVGANSCVITGNYTRGSGGGMYLGTASHSIISSNSARTGGGMYDVPATNCVISSNAATRGDGGGMYRGEAYTCLILGNSASYQGGGMAYATAVNCTVSGNSAGSGGGGLDSGTARNSVIWYNTLTSGGSSNPDVDDSFLAFTCASSVTHGQNGNVAYAPLFQDAANGNYRLKWDSPARNAGDNDYAVGSTDLDGFPRIQDGIVNMGAYEEADRDSDGLTDALEARYGSNPTVRDSDGDGFEDGYEVDQGLSPARNNTAFLTAYVHSNAADNGYFTSDAVLDLAVGDIGMRITNGIAELNVQIWESNDLGTWTNTTPEVQWSTPVDDDKEFFRVRVEP
jgi:hypothetical protein